MPLALLNEHTSDLQTLIEPLLKGQTWGLISDAGLPCIADPGADLVFLAHQKKIDIKTFIGPSSIIMALQLSGFGGQKFTFHGYLPREIPALENKLKELEQEGGTHIWIEAPYRSLKMLEIAKNTLKPQTKLCVAINLTSENERVQSALVATWKQSSFPIEKEPAVFLIG
jgi:16S rRNA (cytidine1402-2'-O)-methyltransferase